MRGLLIMYPLTNQYSRRELVGLATRLVVGGGLVYSMSGVAASQSNSDEEWPQPLFDAKNNAYVPNNTGPPTGSEIQIGEKWRVDAQDGQWNGEPVVTIDDLLIVPGRILPSNDSDATPGGLYAYDIRTGAEQWSFKSLFLNDLVASPDGFVYGLTHDSVYAMNSEDGSVAWEEEIGVSCQSATVSDDTIYVMTRGPDNSDSETLHPSTIKALRRADGSERWSYNFPVYEYEPDQGSVSLPPPAVADGTLYAASAGADTGDVTALSAADGSVQWSVGVNSGNVSAPTVAGVSVYIGTRGRDLDSNTSGGRLDALTLYALDGSTGSEQWSYEAGAMWSPTIGEETVYVGYWNGFAALNGASGEIKWEYTPDSDVVSSPVVTSDSIYITDGTQLKALDKANREVAWSLDIDGGRLSNPVVANQSVFVSSSDGVLHAVGEQGSGSTGGSGSTNPAAGSSSATEAVQTDSLSQQQGTVGGNENLNEGSGGFTAWREFGSSSSTLGIGVLGSVLGLGGIYAAYHRFSRNNNDPDED